MDNNNIGILPPLSIGQVFPFVKYGYALKNALNNQNRWHVKIVHSLIGLDARSYAATTYMRSYDYLKLLENTTLLKCNGKLSPSIVNLYPEANTIVCDYLGEFFQHYLLRDLDNASIGPCAVFDYLLDVNYMNQGYKNFFTPKIIKSAIELSGTLADDFEFLGKSRKILPRLEDSGIEFAYGCGIEDPHIWNFRVIKTLGAMRAFTTDLDYFSDKINCFWEIGYFYATFRWIRKMSPHIANIAEKNLLSLIQERDLQSKFMFWLGALSSYCGYKESLRNLLKDGKICELKEEHRVIKELDEKVSFLAEKLIYETRDENGDIKIR